MNCFKVLLASALALPICAFAQGRAPHGLPSLRIIEMAGEPAACLPLGDSSLLLEGVMVATLDSDWPPQQWAIKLKSGGVPVTLKPGECVRYHQSLAGYAQEGRDLPLKDGETYGFAMRRTHSEDYWADGLYLSVFCLERGADGKRHVRLYIQHEDGSATYPSCGRYVGWKPASDGITPPGYSPPVD